MKKNNQPDWLKLGKKFIGIDGEIYEIVAKNKNNIFVKKNKKIYKSSIKELNKNISKFFYFEDK